MSTHGTSSVAGDSAVRLLRLASQSTEMIPPVKSIVDGALRIAELVVQFKTSQDEWKEFQVYVQNAVATVLHSLASIDGSQSETKLKLEKFQATLEGIVRRIEAKQRESLGWRMIRFYEHPTVIAGMRKEVDDAVSLFKLGAMIRMDITIEKVLELLLQRANKPQPKLTTLLNPILSKLRRVEGASWDPHRVCLENTRQNMIDTILSWLNATDGLEPGKTIFLLTGVAGSGKSAIAHTLAQQWNRNRQLVTSFFFDRDTGDRNNPNHLMGTIAADLCRVDARLAQRILATIENDERVVYAPLAQQFEQLVLEPTIGFVSEQPVVILLDALDEGSNANLLRILCSDACHLPPSIRIFLTSRPSPDIDVLRRKSHVHSEDLKIHEQDNLGDIALFTRFKLSQVAEYHELGSSWPGEELVTSFQFKAEGLFLWAETTCEYLKTCDDPTDELKDLVSAPHMSESTAESRMDILYATILGACNWKSKSFVDSYRRLLGAAVATKTPLTLRALTALYQGLLMPSNPTLRQLSSLITGLSNDPHTTQLVRFLHQSLRDFLTLRAGLPGAPVEIQRYAIVEKSHSQTLALLCLQLLNRDLNASLPGVGFMAKDIGISQEIPLIDQGCISEELWYACRFWIDHIQDVELSVAPDILEELENFLGTRLPLWMELTVSRGRYEGLVQLRGWVNDKLAQHPGIQLLLHNEGQASALGSLSQHLKYMGRKEEALMAAQDEVALNRKLIEAMNNESQGRLARSLCTLSIYLTDLGSLDEALSAADEAVAMQRELKTKSPAYPDADLARSLQRLSVGYSKLGRHEDGLAAIQEAVQLQQQLTSNKESEIALMPDLANFLYNLQSCLYDLGRYEEALTVSQEAVGIYRRLAAERQVVFVQDLAKSIDDLGANLTKLGRFREAITMSQESVDLYRQLATERPAVFTSDLAKSLHSLSYHLSDLGRQAEALTTIQEAVGLRRKLAAERPAVFTSHLAHSLHSLSYNLFFIGCHEEGLTIIQEAVDLRRQLAAERPAVFASDLADSLDTLSCHLSNIGCHEEALTTTQEAVDLCRQLAAERPAVFTSDLADSLHNLSCCLSTLGRHGEALTVIQEAVQLFRPLATDRPSVFNSHLALALCQLARCLYELDDDQAAVVAIRESVELFRPLVQQYPATYATRLSDALRRAAIYLSDTGADEEAQAMREELDALSSLGP